MDTKSDTHKSFPHDSVVRDSVPPATPKKLTTNKRVRKRKKKPQQLTLPSLTGVNPPRTHGFGIWNNPRVVVGVRVDEKLADEFKLVAKRVFGSVCRPVEAFMATIVSTYKTTTLDKPLGVNPSLTIDIGKLIIERNVRTRRRMVVEEETEATAVERGFCEINILGHKCGRPADVLVYFKGKEKVSMWMCMGCFQEHVQNGPMKYHVKGYRYLERAKEVG